MVRRRRDQAGGGKGGQCRREKEGGRKGETRDELGWRRGPGMGGLLVVFLVPYLSRRSEIPAKSWRRKGETQTSQRSAPALRSAHDRGWDTRTAAPAASGCLVRLPPSRRHGTGRTGRTGRRGRRVFSQHTLAPHARASRTERSPPVQG
eukprot:752316-Hanusia_phi.AAC.2